MISPTTISISTLLVFVIYKFLFYPLFLSPLSKVPPAHPTSPLSSFWLNHIRRKYVLNRTIHSLHLKHGPIIRLGPNELSVNSPSALRTIYIGGFDKHHWYRDTFQNYDLPNLVSMLESKPHSVQKRMMAHVFSKSYLQNSEDLSMISRAIVYDRILPTLSDAAKSGKAIDVLELTQTLGVDFTSSYIFGLQNGTDFTRDLSARRKWKIWKQVFRKERRGDRDGGSLENWCISMCKAASKYQPPSTSPPGGPQSTIATTKPIVYTQLSTGLSKLLSPSQTPKETPKDLFIASEMLDQLLAGGETLSITLTYLMHDLSTNPPLQSQLRTELLTLSPPIHPNPSSSQPESPPSLPSPNAIDALPLLSAILTETLRLHSPAPSLQPRITPSPNLTVIENYQIPPGTVVSASAYSLHRNPTIFPNPYSFRPSRWLDAPKEQLVEMKRWFWPFGSGSRMCLGSNFALQGKFYLPPFLGLGGGDVDLGE
jgi:cytochrome P450